MRRDDPRVVVIGAGVSGLATAHRLVDSLPGIEVVVLEAAARAGGAIDTCLSEGFVCEAGPHGFLNRQPSTVALAQRLGIADELLPADESMRRRYVLCDGRLRRYPHDRRSLWTSELLSWTSRLRLWLESQRGGTLEGDPAAGAFFRRRLGRELTNRLVDPMLAGIFGGDLDRLSLRAALPHLVEVMRQGGSVTRALWPEGAAPVHQVGGLPAGRLITLRTGMRRLIDALAQQLGDRLRLRSPVKRLTRRDGAWRIEVGGAHPQVLAADLVVSAAPAGAAARYLGPADAMLSETLRGISSLPVAVVALGYRDHEAPALDGFGYLVPASEGSPVLGMLATSNLFPARCPPGTRLFEALVGGSRDAAVCERDDTTLITTVTSQLSAVLDQRARPIFTLVSRQPSGIPQYEVGHLDRVAAIEGRVAGLPGLYITGNSLGGVGINACTSEAETVSAAAVEYLRQLARPRSPRRRVRRDAVAAQP